MPELPFFTVDVFTDERFGGNPLAVVMGGETLDERTMQAVAAEFNLVLIRKRQAVDIA
jgi:trans-2,3-dihydro-3-hydroxyanthranilate isomerase